MALSSAGCGGREASCSLGEVHGGDLADADLQGTSLVEVRGGDLADAEIQGSIHDASHAAVLQACLRQSGGAQPAEGHPQDEAPTEREQSLGGGGGPISPYLRTPASSNDGGPAADPPAGIPTASAAAPADKTTAATTAAFSVPPPLPAAAVPAVGAGAAAVLIPAAVSSPASSPGAVVEPVSGSADATATKDFPALYECDADGPGTTAMPPIDSNSSTSEGNSRSLQDRFNGFQASPPVVKRPSFTRPPLAKAMLQHQYRRQLAEARGEAGNADNACDDWP